MAKKEAMRVIDRTEKGPGLLARISAVFCTASRLFLLAVFATTGFFDQSATAVALFTPAVLCFILYWLIGQKKGRGGLRAAVMVAAAARLLVYLFVTSTESRTFADWHLLMVFIWLAAAVCLERRSVVERLMYFLISTEFILAGVKLVTTLELFQVALGSVAGTFYDFFVAGEFLMSSLLFYGVYEAFFAAGKSGGTSAASAADLKGAA